MKKLFLLDGMALIYRAHFALSKNPRYTAAGINTSAVMGFANTLMEILRKESPSHIAVVFDTAAPTTRHIEFEAYKAHRQVMPEDLSAAIPYIYRLIEGFRIPVITYDGFEADDIIGTLAKKAEAEDFTVFCMTPDKDFAQLVSDKIFLYRPARMGNGAEVHGVAEVLEKWEIERVDQVIDILGLWGDAVDNIPGIPGIGEKTAKKLIQQYGSMEEIIRHSHELKGKQRENIENFAEQGLISKKLATILLDVPIEFDEESLRLEGPDKELLEPLFAEHEFRTLGKRVFGDEFNVNEARIEGSQIDLFSQPITRSITPDPAPPAETGKNIENTDHDYITVDSDEEISALISLLSKQKAFCFDTETTGTDANCCDILGISFAVEPGKAWYVPFSQVNEECVATLNRFKSLFEDENIAKIGQNLKYDILLLSWYGIRVKGELFDTMLAHYLLDADSRHNMDVLAENYLGYSPIPITKLIGPKGKKQGNMRDIAIDVVTPYACEDADITLQLKKVFEPLLETTGSLRLAREVEFPLIYVLAGMEKEGVRIDVEVLSELSTKLTAEILDHERTIFEKAGVQFNIASPKQLGEVLFDKLQLDPKAKKTKTGQYQTGEDVLLALASKSDIVQDILNFRQLQKLKSTYVDALPQLLNEKSQRLHTCFNQAVASTGRLSSTNPNLQNIPIKTERGREVRKAFIARDENHVIIAADYSQIELRLVAEISGDIAMRDAFIQGLDIHTATAAKVYGVDLDEVTSDMRRNAKAVNFGIIYGQSAFGLSQNLGIPRKEAANMIEQYFIQYPGIRDYMNNTIAFARENGYVETLLKRRRYLRDINSQNATVRGFAERNGINAPIQGSAADMIKIAMIHIFKDIEKHSLKGKMTMQVHDELVFDVPKEEIGIFTEIIENRMKNAIPMEVPIVVEVGVGVNWLEAH